MVIPKKVTKFSVELALVLISKLILLFSVDVSISYKRLCACTCITDSDSVPQTKSWKLTMNSKIWINILLANNIDLPDWIIDIIKKNENIPVIIFTEVKLSKK